jgi:hypothetical protein
MVFDRKRRCLGTSLVMGLLLLPSLSRAEDDPEALIRQGVELRRRGDDVTAHGYFDRAYERSHTPRSSAQLGLSDLALSKWLDAELRLSEALTAPDPWVESHKEALEKARTTARAHLGRVAVTGAPANASVAAGDGAAAALPRDGVIWVNPGTVAIRVQAPGFQPAVREVWVAAGGRAATQVALVQIKPDTPTVHPARIRGGEATAQANPRTTGAGVGGGLTRIPAGEPKSTPVSSTESGRGLRIAGITVAGVGVAAGITGLVLRQIATNKINAINADGRAMPPKDYNPANGNYRTYDQLGIGAMIGGGVALSAGIIGYLVGRGQSSRESSVTFAPGPGRAGVNIGATF